MNLKQKIAMWLCVAACLGSILCAIEASHGDVAFRSAAVMLMPFALVFGVGMWALGLRPAIRSEADNGAEHEWQQNIR